MYNYLRLLKNMYCIWKNQVTELVDMNHHLFTIEIMDKHAY